MNKIAPPPQMLFTRGWKEFRDAGLLWWVNRMLHLFGWAIAVEVNDDDGSIGNVYPCRCRFRGFLEADESDGFKRLSTHLVNESIRLASQAHDNFEDDGLEESHLSR